MDWKAMFYFQVSAQALFSEIDLHLQEQELELQVRHVRPVSYFICSIFKSLFFSVISRIEMQCAEDVEETRSDLFWGLIACSPCWAAQWMQPRADYLGPCKLMRAGVKKPPEPQRGAPTPSCSVASKHPFFFCLLQLVFREHLLRIFLEVFL